MKIFKSSKLLCLILALAALCLLTACGDMSGLADMAEDILQPAEPAETPQEGEGGGPSPDQALIDEFGSYSSKEQVALYVHTYGRLPDNFVTKEQARDKGWEGGSVEPYFPGCCIGGDSFGNREGLLPEAAGRSYQECDIDTLGRDSRGGKRLVFSNDGLIYYTDDHYESFELLYGEE